MGTKLRETSPFFDQFSLDSCSSVLWLWGVAILCLESLETLSSFCSFPYIAQLIVSFDCYWPSIKSHFYRLFSMILDESPTFLGCFL